MARGHERNPDMQSKPLPGNEDKAEYLGVFPCCRGVSIAHRLLEDSICDPEEERFSLAIEKHTAFYFESS
jgi:hypothetical protein